MIGYLIRELVKNCDSRPAAMFSWREVTSRSGLFHVVPAMHWFAKSVGNQKIPDARTMATDAERSTLCGADG
jgi:hypothetical protein